MRKTRQGVRAYYRNRGSKTMLEFLQVLLRDPCVYCGELGCNSIDHIIPKSNPERLTTGHNLFHWTNLAPCHCICNSKKKSQELLSFLMKLKVQEDRHYV